MGIANRIRESQKTREGFGNVKTYTISWYDDDNVHHVAPEILGALSVLQIAEALAYRYRKSYVRSDFTSKELEIIHDGSYCTVDTIRELRNG